MTREQLEQIAMQFNVDGFAQELASVDEPLRVVVCFLGEFSSGKSSLVNALLGRNVLPVMDRPTTGSITIVEPVDGLAVPCEYYQRDQDGQLEPIEFTTFTDIVLGRREGTAVLRVPVTETLPEGFLYVDTPGISSLSKTHVDITYGYLPFMDGAVICVDVNRGGLNQSVIEFLLRPEVRAIAERLLFVVTKQDTKDAASAEKVRCMIVETLQSLCAEQNLTLSDVDERVVLVGGLADVPSGAPFPIDGFRQAFSRFVVGHKQEMEADRRSRRLKEIARALRVALQDQRENLTLDLSDFDRKRAGIEAQEQELHERRSELKARLERLRTEIERDLRNATAGVADELADAPEDEARVRIAELAARIQDLLKQRIQRYLNDFPVRDFAFAGAGIVERLKGITGLANFAETVGTMALFTLLPGGGFYNIAQGGTGAIVARAGTAGARAIAEEGGARLVGSLGRFIRDINPVHLATEAVARFFKKNAAREELDAMVATVAAEVANDLEWTFQTDVFGPLEKELRTLRGNLETIEAERRQATINFSKRRQALDEAISQLTAV